MAHTKPMATKLTESEVEKRLLGGSWTVVEGRLERAYSFKSYADGVAFALKVALLAEKTDHHPDSLEIGWKKVKVAFVTHSAGGISDLDFAAAEKVDLL